MKLIEDRLSTEEIIKSLSETKYKFGYRPSDELIENITQQFWFHDLYYSFITVPEYFDILQQYLLERRPKLFNRYNFYEFFFNQVLGKHLKGIAVKLALAKLTDIALVFELMHTDRLKIDQYKKLLKEIKVEGNLFSIEWLQENNLAILESEEGKKERTIIAWKHHTITEFLIARYIILQKNPIEIATKLMILSQDGIEAFKPSWYGVLRFLLESNKREQFAEWMITFAKKHPEIIDEAFSDLLSSVQIDKVALKATIFDLIYTTYFNKILWISTWTSHALAKLCTNKDIDRFHNDIVQTENETETFVHRGNIVAIINSLVENESSVLNITEREFWKKKIIDYAHDLNTNGVLQRFSLTALAKFKDENIIPLVTDVFEQNTDSLIREAFIRLCYETAPNSKLSIDYMLMGMQAGITIYSRYGIYAITSKEGLSYLLTKFIEKPFYLELFLHNEGIFNSSKEKEDSTILKHIKEVADLELIPLLKKVIVMAIENQKLHEAGNTYFIRQLASIVQEVEPNYLLEIIENIKKKETDERKISTLLYDYQGLFAHLLTENELIQFEEKMETLPTGTKIAQWSIYQAKREREETGKKLFDLAAKSKFIDISLSQKGSDELQKQKIDKNEDIYKEFKRLLEPNPSKYFPEVFSYFINYKNILFKKWSVKDKERLETLALDEGLKKINPLEIKVKFHDLTARSAFNISSVSSYYGDILRVGQILFPEKLQFFHKKIINFIPFSFSEDNTTILEIIPSISDTDLSEVNSIFLDFNDQRKYLNPQSYIHIVSEYKKRGDKLETPAKILESILVDPRMYKHEREYAVETLRLFISSDDKLIKDRLEKIVKESETNTELSPLIETINAILISVYKDKSAIDWRFKELEKRIKPFNEPTSGVVHSVGDFEIELQGMAFARPLIELGDISYLPKFLDLLKFSFKQLEKENADELLSYVNYLWRVVIAFVDSLKKYGSFEPLKQFKEWINENAKGDNSNWLKGRVSELQAVYVQFIGQRHTIDEAIEFTRDNHKSLITFTEEPRQQLNENSSLKNVSLKISDKIILKITTIFPFRFSPDSVIIDEQKISIVHKEFFFVTKIECILINNIQHVEVVSSLVFATLRILPSGRSESWINIRYLRKKEAMYALRLIKKLSELKKEGINLSQLTDYTKNKYLQKLLKE